MIRENKFPIPEFIPPQHVLVSVFDKTDLAVLVDGLLAFNHQVHFYATGGTGQRIAEILSGRRATTNYTPIERFTSSHEMEGGLVKTLHPKIHAGLLGERQNPQHALYLQQMASSTGSSGVYFDIMVGNFYPFSEAVEQPDATPEQARINIDIGGPTMIMAAAKNWHSVAVLTNPQQYRPFLNEMHGDCRGISAALRFSLAKEAIHLVAQYRKENDFYFSKLDFERDVRPHLVFQGK